MNNKKRLLLIDDDDDDWFFLYTAVQTTGFHFELLHESDCATALKKLSTGSLPVPELIFLDWHMPKIDGRECLKEIRNITGCTDIPIVLLTGSASPVIWETVNKFGNSSVLNKSWDLRELKKGIEEVFSRYKLEK